MKKDSCNECFEELIEPLKTEKERTKILIGIIKEQYEEISFLKEMVEVLQKGLTILSEPTTIENDEKEQFQDE